MAHIYVSAGHGGKQPGAVRGTLVEKNYTLHIANALTVLLRAAGHTVTQNRTVDADCLPETAVKLANASGADMFIEIHLNAGGGTGCECYHYKTDAAGKTIAANICTAISALGYCNRGTKTSNLYVINKTKMTAVLVECCFIDSADDMKSLDVYKTADAICEGILQTYPATVKPVVVTESPPATVAVTASTPTPTMRVGATMEYTGRVYFTSYGIRAGKTISGTFKVDNYIVGRAYGVHISAGWIKPGDCTVIG